MLSQEKLNAVIKLALANQLLYSVMQDVQQLQYESISRENDAANRHLYICLDSLEADLLSTKNTIDVIKDSYTGLYLTLLRLQHSQSDEKNVDSSVDSAFEFLVKEN